MAAKKAKSPKSKKSKKVENQVEETVQDSTEEKPVKTSTQQFPRNWNR